MSDLYPLGVVAGTDRVFTTGDGVRIHYIEAGAGQPLVMLPGWSQSAAMFGHQIAGLGDRFRVIAVDPRGHGDSEAPAHGYNPHRMALDVRELILALDLEDVVLLGHSSGVKYVWAYWEMFEGDRLSKLIIVDDSPRLLDNPAWSPESRAEVGPMYFRGELDDFSSFLLGGPAEERTREAIRGMFSPGFIADNPEIFDWIVAENLKMPREKAMELLYATSGMDWRGTIGRIALPTLVIGAEGSTHKVAVISRIAKRIKGARLRIFEREEGGSHFMFMENPKAFNAEVAAFIAEGPREDE
jgi:pimeloyl-ACP methyl ester carboxylesterase